MLPDREAYWRKELGRLRLGAEPIEDQIARHRRALWALAVTTLVIGSMILAIFGSFGRLDIGAAVAGLIVIPVVATAWIGYARLRHRASLYLRELAGTRGTEPPRRQGRQDQKEESERMDSE